MALHNREDDEREGFGASSRLAPGDVDGDCEQGLFVANFGLPSARPSNGVPDSYGMPKLLASNGLGGILLRLCGRRC